MKQVVIAATLALANATFASSIAPFGDPQYATCNLNIPAPPGFANFYIVAVDCSEIQGACPVFTGAQFRVEGLPPGWLVTFSPSPEAIAAVGDPFEAGAYIAFPYLTSNRVLLYTVTVFPIAPGAEATLRVTAPSPPPNPNYDCPMAYVGDCPAPPAVCVSGGTLFVNRPDPCTVGVRESSWPHVKGLYE